MHSGRQDLSSAPGWEGPMDCQVGSPGCPHLYPALPDTRENTSRNKGLSLDPGGLRFTPGLRMQRPHSHLASDPRTTWGACSKGNLYRPGPHPQRIGSQSLGWGPGICIFISSPSSSATHRPRWTTSQYSLPQGDGSGGPLPISQRRKQAQECKSTCPK